MICKKCGNDDEGDELIDRVIRAAFLYVAVYELKEDQTREELEHELKLAVVECLMRGILKNIPSWPTPGIIRVQHPTNPDAALAGGKEEKE